SQPEERKEINDLKHQTQELQERRSVLQKDLGRLEAQLELASEREPGAPEAAALTALVKNLKAKLQMALQSAEPAKLIHEALRDIDQVLQERRPGERPASDAG